jgi:pyruvate/2-oxoglutarate dehydrogenase complex dihydrolipoamide dehydrogenase (E3) component
LLIGKEIVTHHQVASKSTPSTEAMLDQENTKPLSVAIIGAGIGGLVCAIACRRQGLQVTVLEQAHEIKAVRPLDHSHQNAYPISLILDVY